MTREVQNSRILFEYRKEMPFRETKRNRDIHSLSKKEIFYLLFEPIRQKKNI